MRLRLEHATTNQFTKKLMFASRIIMGMIYGFLIELIKTGVFNERQ